jgi:hypothetical protein
MWAPLVGGRRISGLDLPVNTASSLHHVPASRSFDILTVDLIDGIAEAVASPPDPHTRSAAICSLVREIYETMEWLHGADASHEELVSLRQVVAEAQKHQERMSALRDSSVGSRSVTP